MDKENLDDEIKPEYDLESMKIRKVGKGREKFQQSEDDEMLPEYTFDYSKSRPNRFVVAYWESKKK